MEMTFETPGAPTYPSTGVEQKRHLGQFSLPTGVSRPCIHLRARCLKDLALFIEAEGKFNRSQQLDFRAKTLSLT
jgi:hypothetical protein